MESEFVEFEITNDKNFADLNSVFQLFKEAKDNEDLKEDVFWLNIFPRYALEKFCFFENDVKPIFKTAAAAENVWHFYSLTELMQHDYEIEYIRCYKVNETLGKLEYSAYSFPYGGPEGLIMFIKAFDCNPVKVNDGSGIYQISFLEDGSLSLTEQE